MTRLDAPPCKVHTSIQDVSDRRGACAAGGRRGGRRGGSCHPGCLSSRHPRRTWSWARVCILSVRLYISGYSICMIHRLRSGRACMVTHPPRESVCMHTPPCEMCRCGSTETLLPRSHSRTEVLCDTQPARPVPVRCGVHIQGRYLTDREGCLMTKGIVYGSSVCWTVMRAFLTRGS